MKNITTIILIISALVALGVAYLAYDQGKNVTNEISIPVLNQTVPPNTKITAEMIGIIQVDEKVSTDLPIVTNPEQIIGRIALRTIYPNVPIIQNELVDAEQFRYDQSNQNYFMSMDLAELGGAKLPYGFSHGKINVCLITDDTAFMGIFSNGLPPAEKLKYRMTDVRCPVRNLAIIGLTADNTVPMTYITYDANAGKFIFPNEAVRIGIWLPNQEMISDLVQILHRPAVGGGSYKLFFTLPPYDVEADPDKGQLVIEKLFQSDAYEEFEIPWRPEDLEQEGFTVSPVVDPYAVTTTPPVTDTMTTPALTPTPAP